MRECRDVFHLAIPAYDLADTEEFYVGQLGCKLARRYGDRITVGLLRRSVGVPSERPARRRHRDLSGSTPGTSA